MKLGTSLSGGLAGVGVGAESIRVMRRGGQGARWAGEVATGAANEAENRGTPSLERAKWLPRKQLLST